MIRQPEWGTRNVNKYFYESEARRIAALNEIFEDIELTEAEMRTLVWLCGWEECTVENVLSAIRKAMAAEAKRREGPLRPTDGKALGRAQRQLLIERSLSKVLLRYFRRK